MRGLPWRARGLLGLVLALALALALASGRAEALDVRVRQRFGDVEVAWTANGAVANTTLWLGFSVGASALVEEAQLAPLALPAPLNRLWQVDLGGDGRPARDLGFVLHPTPLRWRRRTWPLRRRWASDRAEEHVLLVDDNALGQVFAAQVAWCAWTGPQAATACEASGVLEWDDESRWADGRLEIAVGTGFTCTLLERGHVRCWGTNTVGQLGVGSAVLLGDDEAVLSIPTVDLGGARAVRVVVGADFACALLAAGSVRCWGNNAMGQLGLGHARSIGDDEQPISEPPVNVSASGSVADLAAGLTHVCAVLSDGSVQCWGDNRGGALGVALMLSCGVVTAPALCGLARFPEPAALAAAGFLFTCVILRGPDEASVGRVRCWGENWAGQLGLGGAGGYLARPDEVNPLVLDEPAVQLACGDAHVCVLLLDGAVVCWGSNEHGTLGQGHPYPVSSAYATDLMPPVALPGPVAEIAARWETTCALLESGRVQCWGANENGQLGVGHSWREGDVRPVDPTHTLLRIGRPVVAIGVGTYTSCHLSDAGGFQCVGFPFDYMLGHGVAVPSLSRVSGLRGQVVEAVRSRGVLTRPSVVFDPMWDRADPVRFSGIATGTKHACGLTRGGTVRCWGDARGGRLGSIREDAGFPTTPELSPDIQLPLSVTKVVCGAAHTCVLLVDGSVSCWGDNSAGQIGRPGIANTGDIGATPARLGAVDVGLGVLDITAAESTTCALLNDSVSFRCWGAGPFGQLGLGFLTTENGRTRPPSDFSALSFAGGVTIVQLVMGAEHGCARDTVGALRCWGNNNVGQLGFSSPNGKHGDDEPIDNTPTVPMSVAAVDLSIGQSITCIVDGNGRVRCGGLNTEGQGGIPFLRNFVYWDDEPRIGGAAVRVRTFGGRTCAILATQRMRCWGKNEVGQLGLGIASTIGDDEHPESAPFLFDASHNVTDVALGGNALTCALVDDGRVSCWGENAQGELGTGDRAPIGYTHPAFVPPESQPMNAVVQFDGKPIRSIVLPDVFRSTITLLRIHARDTAVPFLPDPAGLGNELADDVVAIFARATRALSQCPVDFRTVGDVDVCVYGNASEPLPSLVTVPDPEAHPESWSTETDAQRSALAWTNADPHVVVARVEVATASGRLRTTGGSTVRFLGSFGWLVATGLPRIEIGGQSCAPVTATGFGLLQCTAGPGTGANLSAVFTWDDPINGSVSATAPQPVSYDPPSVVSVLPSSDLDPRGTTVVRIQGESFGSASLVRSRRVWVAGVGEATLLNRSTDNDFELACLLPPSYTLTGTLLVEVDGQVGVAPAPIQYRQPRIDGLLPAEALPSNFSLEHDFLLRGVGFHGAMAPWSLTSVRIGGQPCPSATALNDSFIQCTGLVAPPVWTSSVVEVTIGDQVAQATSSVVFSPQPAPRLASVVPNLVPLVGAVEVVLAGVGFGTRPSDVVLVTLGGSRLASWAWMSGTELRITIPPGVGANQPVVVWTRGGLHSNSLPCSYESPVISSVRPPFLLAGEADAEVEVCGSGLGLEVDHVDWLRIGGAECPRSSLSVRAATQCVVCSPFTAPDTWVNAMSVVVAVGGQVGAATRDAFEGLPLPSTRLLSPSSVPSLGGSSVRIVGSGFGRSLADLAAVRVGNTTVLANSGLVRFLSEQEVELVVPPGVGARAPLVVRSRTGRESAPISLGYFPPRPSRVQPNQSMPSAALQDITVCGEDLGHRDEDVEELFVGGLPCGRHVVEGAPAGCVLCEGVNSSQGWSSPGTVSITVGGQSSGVVRGLFQGLPFPTVRSVVPMNATTDSEITVFGSGFGASPADLTAVRIGGVPCESITWQSSEVVRCVVPHALGSQNTSQLLGVDVTTRFGLTSSSSSPLVRVSEPSVVVLAPPVLAPRQLRVVRSLERGEQAVVTWEYATFEREQSESAPLSASQTTEFVLEWTQQVLGGAMKGVAAEAEAEEEGEGTSAIRWEGQNGSVAVPLASLQSAVVLRDHAGRQLLVDREVHTSTLTLSGPGPVWVRVFASSRFGSGPALFTAEPTVDMCASEEFLSTQRAISDWMCLPCPPGAFCGGANASTALARSGFWRVPWSRDGLGFAECLFATACRGWSTPELAAPDATATSVGARRLDSTGESERTAEAEGCAEGYEGVLCDSCALGFYRGLRGECSACGTSTEVVGRAVGLMLVVAVLLGAALHRAYQNAGETSSESMMALKSVFNHLQMLSVLGGIELAWPSAAKTLMSGSGVASSFAPDTVAIECLLGSEGGSVLARALVNFSTPAWLLLYAGAFWSVVLLVPWDQLRARGTRCLGGRTPNTVVTGSGATTALTPLQGVLPASPSSSGDRRRLHRGTLLAAVARSGVAAPSAAVPASPSPSTASNSLLLGDTFTSAWLRRMRVSLVVLVFLLHTTITRTAFRLVTCRNVAPLDDPSAAQYRLVADLDEDCRDPSTLKWMLGLAIPVLVFFSLGVPSLAAFYLWWNRRLLDRPEMVRLLGFLYRGFRAGFEGWESLIMARKVLLVGVTVVLGPAGTMAQILGSQVLVMLAMALHAWWKPFENAALNRLEIVSLIVTSVNLSAGMLAELDPNSEATSSVVAVIVLLSNILYFALVLRMILRARLEEWGRVAKPPSLATDPASNASPTTPQSPAAMVVTPLVARGVALPTVSEEGTVSPLTRAGEPESLGARRRLKSLAPGAARVPAGPAPASAERLGSVPSRVAAASPVAVGQKESV